MTSVTLEDKALCDQTLLVIGLGLIGGSLAAACKKQNNVGRVIGYSRKQETMAKAEQMGIVDACEPDLAKAVAQADIIFLAVPILSIRSSIELIQPHLKPGAVVTDGGSVKGNVVADARAVLTAEQLTGFVPGHPIAGAERSGVTAANPDLYQAHRVILTPLPETSEQATQTVISMWQSVGAGIDRMEVAHHDEVLAATSHLPHLLAFNLVDTLSKQSENREIFNYAAGGFRDFTRIAASDPIMWHDIFLANRQPVLKVLDQFLDELHKLRNAVAHADGQYMKQVFTEAKEARDHFSELLKAREQENSE